LRCHRNKLRLELNLAQVVCQLLARLCFGMIAGIPVLYPYNRAQTMTKDIKPPRLTRAQIAEGLESVPLDTILLGTRTETRLTAKQKAFARSLALGNSKAQAYRETHNSKATKKTQANNGYRLAQREDIQTIKEAYELAIEAAKQRTPAQLRELVIHQLTQHCHDRKVTRNHRISSRR